MLNMRCHHFSGATDIADLDSNVAGLEWFAFDPHAPTPYDEGLTTVVVDDVVTDIEDYIVDQISNYSNPLQD